ncbi:hypothetical protein ACIBQ0_03635 [Nocardia nova]|uniref:hypothetical protein n=1 Tax=Nocardia nova TaxID=37330 RepID=UPI0037B23FAD
MRLGEGAGRAVVRYGRTSACLVVGPLCLASIRAAALAFAAVGEVAGTLIGGGVALADGLWKYLLTLQSPPGREPVRRSRLGA